MIRSAKAAGPALDMPEEFGGQGLPYVMGTAVGEMFSASNQAFTMYQGLTHGAASAIMAHGTDEQKEPPICPIWSAANGPAP